MRIFIILTILISFPVKSEFNFVESQKYFEENMFETGSGFLIFENTELLKSVNYKVYYLINLANTNNRINAHYNWHSSPKRIEISISLDRFLNFKNEREIHQSIAWHEYYHVISEKDFKEYYPRSFNNFFDNQAEYYRMVNMRYESNKHMQMNEFLADLYSFRKMNGKIIEKNFDEYRDPYNDRCAENFIDPWIEFKTHPCVDDRLDFIKANKKENIKLDKKNFDYLYNNLIFFKRTK